MKYTYKIFEIPAGCKGGYPSEIAPEAVEFECPSNKPYRTAEAIWCNILERNIDYFRKCEETGTLVTFVVIEHTNSDMAHKIMSVANIPNNGKYKVIGISDIDY